MWLHECKLIFLEEKYQEKWENAYLIIKNARTSRALMQALDPQQYYTARFARSTSLRYFSKISENISGPPPWPNPGSATVVLPVMLVDLNTILVVSINGLH